MLLYDRQAAQNKKKKRERQTEARLFDPLRARRHEDDGSDCMQDRKQAMYLISKLWYILSCCSNIYTTCIKEALSV